MNRRRKSKKTLPPRVYLNHGSYFFCAVEPIRVKGEMKKWVKLCRESDGEPAMLRALADLIGEKAIEKDTMPYLCSEYKANRLGKYGKDTKAQYSTYLDMISAAFTEFLVIDATTKDCAEFLRSNFKEKHNTAVKVSGLMKRMFKYAISELGLRQDNPMDQIDVSDYDTERRTILPTHEQVKAIRAAGMMSKKRSDTNQSLPNPSGPMFCCLVDMAYLCWQRAIDVRTLKESQIVDGRIKFAPSKTAKSSGKAVDIIITPAIQDVIDRARAIKHGYKMISPYLFPVNRGKNKGGPYTKSGLFSAWDRARDRLGIDKDSPPDERIQFKDLRALGATDAAKAGKGIEEIRARLAHTTSQTSEIYIKEVVPETSNLEAKLPW